MGYPIAHLPYQRTEKAKNVVSITVPRTCWKPCGPDDDITACLTCCLTINGTNYHLTAYAVMTNSELGQTAVHAQFNDEVDKIYELGRPVGPFCTTEIDGRDYLLTIIPYC